MKVDLWVGVCVADCLEEAIIAGTEEGVWEEMRDLLLEMGRKDETLEAFEKEIKGISDAVSLAHFTSKYPLEVFAFVEKREGVEVDVVPDMEPVWNAVATVQRMNGVLDYLVGRAAKLSELISGKTHVLMLTEEWEGWGESVRLVNEKEEVLEVKVVRKVTMLEAHKLDAEFIKKRDL